MRLSFLKKTAVIAGSLSCAGIIGCAVDSTVILEHPNTAQPGQVISVKMADLLIYQFSDTNVVQLGITRDSFHVAVGAPQGYSVSSVKMYAAKNYHILKKTQGITDTTGIENALTDSLTTFQSRATTMSSDASKAYYFSKRLIMAKEGDAPANSVYTSTDSIAAWSVYSGKLGLSIPTGTLADYTTKKSNGVSDSTATIMIPVYVYLSITTRPTPSVDTLYYFTSTDSLSRNDTGTGGFTSPNWVYHPLTVQNTGITYKASRGSSLWSMMYNPAARDVAVYYNALQGHHLTIDVYSASGVAVKQLIVPNNTGAGQGVAHWNGTNSAGGAAPAGTYIISVKNGTSCISKTIHFAR